MSADIWRKGGGVEVLLPSSALRIADHHLHASALLTWDHGSNKHGGHDWFCVSQAVRCFPGDRLHEKSADDAYSSLFVTKVGTSSIHLGNTLMLKDETVATAQRVFCRVSSSTSSSAAFTDQERNKFFEYKPSSGLSFPQLERFDGVVMPETLQDSKSVLSVKVGPQHINFANHVDHACIAETAFHALFLLTNKEESENNLIINYLGQPSIGDVLECFVHEDKIYITTKANSGENKLVAIAK